MDSFECPTQEFGEPSKIYEPGSNLYSGVVGNLISRNTQGKFERGKIQHRGRLLQHHPSKSVKIRIAVSS